MYSLTRSSMTTQLCTMTSGIRNVVRMTNSIEMPSTPSLNCMTSSQPRCSTNWKPALVGSNFTQMISEIRKVMTVVHSATQRALPLASRIEEGDDDRADQRHEHHDRQQRGGGEIHQRAPPMNMK